MARSLGFFADLEYSLAAKLYSTRWLPRSYRKHQMTMRLFQRAADAGHLKALSTYGHLLFHRGLSEQDKAQGASYLLRAAQLGEPKSQYQAACIYEKGCHTYRRSDEKAVTWYARAGEGGHYLAAMRLAEAYAHGDLGLLQCESKSRHWRELAFANAKRAHESVQELGS